MTFFARRIIKIHAYQQSAHEFEVKDMNDVFTVSKTKVKTSCGSSRMHDGCYPLIARIMPGYVAEKWKMSHLSRCYDLQLTPNVLLCALC